MSRLYFDHAATSFPKAPGVPEEAARFLREDAGNPGRGGHALAARAADALHRARLGLSRLLGVGDASRLALTSGTTESLNVALRGVLGAGERVLVGADAHNSVLRPLHVLKGEREVAVDEVRTDDVLRWDLADLEEKLRTPTALVVVSHASNVTGTIQPLDRIVECAHAAGAKVLVDGAQTVGSVLIDVATQKIDMLAFSGHKALLGPPGTGGLYVRAGIDVAPLITGGTGSASESEVPPEEFPVGLETGTANALGFAALATALDWIRAADPDALRVKTEAVRKQFFDEALSVPGITLFAGGTSADLPTASFVVEGWDPQELATVLDGFEIAVRAGLHCAPRAHQRLGTLPAGTVRASLGPFVEADHVGEFWELVRRVCAG